MTTSSWIEVSLKVIGDMIAVALSAFEELGALAVTQKNAGEDDYYDLAHPAEPGWRKQKIVALFDAGVDQTPINLLLASCLPLDTKIEVKPLADQDWESAWIDQYQPTKINERVWIYPSWSELPKLNSTSSTSTTIIRIDPGLAFGTGTHPTTAMCLDALSDFKLEGASVMDYGCGSGILAITALLMGAKSAVGIDIDPQAEIVSRENARLNGVAECFTIQSGCEKHSVQKVQDECVQYDIVIANILAGALIDLVKTLSTLVKPGGHLLLSGILETQTDSVMKVYQDNFELETRFTHEWALLVGQKCLSGPVA